MSIITTGIVFTKPRPPWAPEGMLAQIQVDGAGCVWLAAEQFAELVERLPRIEAAVMAISKEDSNID